MLDELPLDLQRWLRSLYAVNSGLALELAAGLIEGWLVDEGPSSRPEGLSEVPNLQARARQPEDGKVLVRKPLSLF